MLLARKAGTSNSDKDPTGLRVTKPFTMQWFGIPFKREKQYSQVCESKEGEQKMEILW